MNIFDRAMNASTPFLLIGLVFSIMLVITLLILPIVYQIDKKLCLDRYQDYKPIFSLFGGCKIDFEGKLTPVDMIKNINLK